MKIAIDIGHADGTGATGVGGLQEHAVCEQIAPLLADELTAAGHVPTVIDFPDLTNRGDLRATAQAVNAGDYDLLVSLHCDAAAHEGAKGAHVCYTSSTGKTIAGHIARHLCALLPGRACPTVHRSDLYILNQTRPPAVLCECGFITSPHDAEYLKLRKRDIAHAIAVGIASYASTL